MLEGQFTDLQHTVFFVLSCCHGVDASWGVTVGCETSEHVGRSEGTARSTCKVRTCIRFQLSVGLRYLQTCRELDVFPFVFTRRDHHQFTASSRSDHTSFVENGSILCCGPSGPAFAFANLRSWTLLHSSCIAVLATFCVECPSRQAVAKIIVMQSSTCWSYSCHCLTLRTCCERTRTTISTHYNTQYTIWSVNSSVYCTGNFAWTCLGGDENGDAHRYAAEEKVPSARVTNTSHAWT